MFNQLTNNFPSRTAVELRQSTFTSFEVTLRSVNCISDPVKVFWLQPSDAMSTFLSLNLYLNVHTWFNANTSERVKRQQKRCWCKIFSLWGIFLSSFRPHEVWAVEGIPKRKNTARERKFLRTFFPRFVLTAAAPDKNKRQPVEHSQKVISFAAFGILEMKTAQQMFDETIRWSNC